MIYKKRRKIIHMQEYPKTIYFIKDSSKCFTLSTLSKVLFALTLIIQFYTRYNEQLFATNKIYMGTLLGFSLFTTLAILYEAYRSLYKKGKDTDNYTIFATLLVVLLGIIFLTWDLHYNMCFFPLLALLASNMLKLWITGNGSLISVIINLVLIVGLIVYMFYLDDNRISILGPVAMLGSLVHYIYSSVSSKKRIQSSTFSKIATFVAFIAFILYFYCVYSNNVMFRSDAVEIAQTQTLPPGGYGPL